MYRVAEAYLNAAELLLETGGDANQAKDYVNKIRNRAGINQLTSVTVDDVINERHLEFVGEGKRYFDLVRTGKAASVLVPDEYGYRTNSWTESKKYIPIAHADLDSAPALVQHNYSRSESTTMTQIFLNMALALLAVLILVAFSA